MAKDSPKKYPRKTREIVAYIPASHSDAEKIEEAWDALGIEARYEMPIAVWKHRKKGGKKWERWNEEDHAEFRETLENRVRVDSQNLPDDDKDRIKKFRIRVPAYNEALTRLAGKRTVWPLRNWVKKCKADPDSDLRLDNWLTLGFGSPEDLYSAYVQEYFFTSLVKRILEPGCKVKCAVVFVGPSGIGKSPMLDFLLPEEFRADFVSTGIDFALDAPKLYPSFEGRALLVLGEMAGIRRAEEAVLKNTLDAPSLDFIPKHKGEVRHFPLSGIFCGTANPDENFLPPGKVVSERFLVLEMDIPRFIEEYQGEMPVEKWITANAPHLVALAREKIRKGQDLNLFHVPPEISEARTKAGADYRGCLNPELLEDALQFIKEEKENGADRSCSWKELRTKFDPNEKISTNVFSKVLKDNAGFTQKKNKWFLPE